MAYEHPFIVHPFIAAARSSADGRSKTSQLGREHGAAQPWTGGDRGEAVRSKRPFDGTAEPFGRIGAGSHDKTPRQRQRAACTLDRVRSGTAREDGRNDDEIDRACLQTAAWLKLRDLSGSSPDQLAHDADVGTKDQHAPSREIIESIENFAAGGRHWRP